MPTPRPIVIFVMSHYRRLHTPGGTFFFTVTLADRDSALLVEQIDRLRASYRRIKEKCPFETIAICIMPDHIHAIWTLPEGDSDYSRRWNLIKAGFSRGLPGASGVSPSKKRKREKGIWQRRFWEHQIRDDADLVRHVDYIHYNPVKHGLVSSVADWPHSSFHEFVARGWASADWSGAPGDEGDWGE